MTYRQIRDALNQRMETFWENFIRYQPSFFWRFSVAVLVGAIGVGIAYLLYLYTGIYFASVTVFTVVFITIYSGLISGIVLTVILNIIMDFFFVHPIGTVLDTVEALQHFWVVTALGIVLAFFVSSIRVSYHKTLIAKHEAQLARTKAEQAVRSRDEMAGVISHELKNPLSALQAGVQLIKKLLPSDPKLDQIRTLLDRQMPAIHRMNRLISDLLDVQRIEAQALTLQPIHCQIAPIIHEAVRMQEGLAAEKLVQLRAEISTHLPTVYCDPSRTVQVILNLVGNAVKFTNAGGTVVIRAQKKTIEEIEIQVSDNGKGISEEQLPHLFQRFWQASETAHLGTGLGLAITKGLVELQGGSIWVESKVGRGSTFHFTIPVAPDMALRKTA